MKRITGLDPAGPVYDKLTSAERLDQNDADLVDVLNTNSVFGIVQSLGHKNFYPNGGNRQPGCLLRDLSPIVNFVGCSHKRAVSFFIESINSSCKFTSYLCSDYGKLRNLKKFTNYLN
jgi:hypothetical protein